MSEELLAAATGEVLVIENEAHALRLVGPWLGASDWLPITQKRVDGFADVTEDRQWIHLDVERARSGPYGTTVAHGMLTLSLIARFIPQIVSFDAFSMIINYGFGRVRFPAALRVGQQIRGVLRFDSVAPFEGGFQLTCTVNVQVAGGDKPVCSAELLIRLVA